MPKLSTIDDISKLTIPSIYIKKFLKNEIQIKEYKIFDDKKDDKKEDNFISIGNSQYVLSKSIELMISYLINESIIFMDKGDLGLYDLSFKDIKNAIYQNNELLDNFKELLFDYKPEMNYNVLENKDLISFIDKINKNIKIQNSAINFLQYLINYYCCKFLYYSYCIMKEFNRMRINSSIISICWNILFKGKYHDRIFKEMEEIIALIDTFKKEKKEKDEEKKNKKEEENKKIEEENKKVEIKEEVNN